MGRKQQQKSLCKLKKQFKYRKPICPFICSTFQDFQIERDILVKKVFPTLDALCRERGTYCAPIDLRWGINDHQVSSGQVINLCLDYVTKCAPFFICILGERFGSHRPHDGPALPKSYKDLPSDAHWMDKNLVAAGSSGYSWVTDEQYQDSSVTALEVEQRNLLSTDMGDEFSFYYFRQQEHLDLLYTDLPEKERQEKLQIYQPESEHCNNEIRELKARIVKRGIPVRYFKSPEELRQLVLDDWIEVVNQLYPPFYQDIPDIHKESLTEWTAHEAFAETRRRVFVRTPELDSLFDELTQFSISSLDDPPPIADQCPQIPYRSFSSLLRKNNRKAEEPSANSMLLLVGERGCGKSAVIANWFKDFQEGHPEVKVMTHFVGCSAHSTDVHSLMRRFTHEIRNEYPDFQGTATASTISSANTDEVSDLHQVCEAFQAALSLGPCVLVLDGVDELGDTYGCSSAQVKEMSWIPCPLPPQCKIIITSAHSDTSHKVLSQRGDTRTLQVPLLKDTNSKTQVVREYLAIHCKCLDEKQLERIVSCKLSDRPIFLTVLANELRVFGVYNRLDYHLESYLEALSIRDLWSKIVQRWIKDYSWSSDEAGKQENGDSESTELTGWVADALRLLAVSRNGLSRAEILDMMEQLGYHGNKKVTCLDWAMFRSAALDSLLERPGGLINFFHQHFKEAVQHSLFGAATPTSVQPEQTICLPLLPTVELTPPNSKSKKFPTREEYHKHIGMYFKDKEHGCRRSEDLPYQLLKAKEFKVLAEVLSEPRLFLEMAGDRIMHRKRIELVKYWKILIKAGHSIADTYWKMLETALGQTLTRPSSTGSLFIKGKKKEMRSECEPKAPIPSKLPSPPPTPKTPTTRIPFFTKDSPSISRENSVVEDAEVLEREEGNSENEGDASRRRNSSSNESISSVGSCASSMDPNEAFINGRARGAKELARLTMSTGQFLSIMSCFVDAEKMLLSAHEKLGQIAFSADCQRLLCGLEESIGNMYLYQLRKDTAQHWYNMALKTVDELLAVLRTSEDDNTLMEMKGRLLDQLGNMKTYSRDFVGAERMLTRARSCFDNSKSMIGRAIVHYHIGFLRMQQGDFESAETLFYQALSCIERWFGKKHPRVAEVLNDLAALLCHPDNKTSQDLVQAESLHRRALEIRETCFGGDHLLVATSLFHLGKLLKGQKSPVAQSEALVMLRRALDVRTTRLGEKHGLTKAVRRALNDLEVTLQCKDKPAPDMRSDDLPLSTLTCRDERLQVMEKKAKEKAETEQDRKRQSKKLKLKINVQCLEMHNIVLHTETLKSPSAQNVQSKSETGSFSNLSMDTASVDDPAEEITPKTATASECLQNTMETDKQYLDTYAFDLPKIRKSTKSRTLKTRPKSAPILYHSADLSTIEPSISALRTPPNTIHHYASLSIRKSHSSPVSHNKLVRRCSSGHIVSHRHNCLIPGPHSIDVHNAYSAIYGPNTNMYSLLGPPETPRYNAKANGIHHASAWYHVPGRYPTTDRPYPSKRLQKRTDQQKINLTVTGSREGDQTMNTATWNDSCNDDIAREQPGKGDVRFGLESDMVQKSLLISH